MNHPLPAFRQGVLAALDQALFKSEEPPPADLVSWARATGPSVAVLIPTDETQWSTVAALVQEPQVVVVIVVSSLNVREYARALHAGADGVAHLDAPVAVLAHTIASAIGGEIVLPAQLARDLSSRFLELGGDSPAMNDRELLLLRRLAEGLPLSQIASEDFYSERTLRRHLQNVYLKLGVANRAQAIRRASECGYLR